MGCARQRCVPHAFKRPVSLEVSGATRHSEMAPCSMARCGERLQGQVPPPVKHARAGRRHRRAARARAVGSCRKSVEDGQCRHWPRAINAMGTNPHLNLQDPKKRFPATFSGCMNAFISRTVAQPGFGNLATLNHQPIPGRPDDSPDRTQDLRPRLERRGSALCARRCGFGRRRALCSHERIQRVDNPRHQ